MKPEEDLYKRLGVRKNASPDSIKKAYRKKARELHPDAGGDEEEFKKLQLAYDVLKDPGRRAHYDATGEVEAFGGPTLAPAIQQMLTDLVDEVMFPGDEDDRPDPEREDILLLMKEKLGEFKEQAEEEIKERQKRVKTLEKTEGRFTTDEEDNILGGAVRATKEALHRSAERWNHKLEQIEILQEILDNHKYTYDKAPTGTGARMRMIAHGGPFNFTFTMGE